MGKEIKFMIFIIALCSFTAGTCLFEVMKGNIISIATMIILIIITVRYFKCLCAILNV